jgi:hypothetical protein
MLLLTTNKQNNIKTMHKLTPAEAQQFVELTLRRYEFASQSTAISYHFFSWKENKLIDITKSALSEDSKFIKE